MSSVRQDHPHPSLADHTRGRSKGLRKAGSIPRTAEIVRGKTFGTRYLIVLPRTLLPIGDGSPELEHERADARHLLEVDLRGLVGNLVVVLVRSRREHQDRDPLLRVVVVIAAFEVALRMIRVVEGSIDL